MLPALCHVGNRLPIDADGDLKRLSFVPMDNEWIGAFVCRRISWCCERIHAGRIADCGHCVTGLKIAAVRSNAWTVNSGGVRVDSERAAITPYDVVPMMYVGL